MNGGIGVQGHYANGLAALFIATGQDAACVSEASVGMTRMEMTVDGSLYTSVTLPNVIVGTVGGGTGLPSQRACLEMMGLAGEGKVNAFAEVTAAVALAGELSIIGALSAGDFARRINAWRAAATPPRRPPPMPNKWWVYQGERFPVVAHGALIAAFSLSAVCFSALLRGAAAFPPLRTLLVAFVSSFTFFLQLAHRRRIQGLR